MRSHGGGGVWGGRKTKEKKNSERENAFETAMIVLFLFFSVCLFTDYCIPEYFSYEMCTLTNKLKETKASYAVRCTQLVEQIRKMNTRKYRSHHYRRRTHFAGIKRTGQHD